jgi:hypothetical protein
VALPLSYHPLLAFCTDTQEILQAWLRTGSAYPSNGIVELMKQLLAQLPQYHRIVLRTDSGFRVGARMDLLDAGGHGYLIKVKLKGLGPPTAGPTTLDADSSSARLGAMRAPISRQRLDAGPVLCGSALSKSPRTIIRRASCYPSRTTTTFCYVTTEAWSPWQAHRAYGERATSETWIEQAKSQMGLAHLKTDHFLANTALFQNAPYWPTTPCAGWRC